MRLKGRVALVTGATGDIGGSIAAKFAAEGATVVVSGRRRERVEPVAARIRDAGGNSIAVEADVSKPREVTRMFREIGISVGRLDILVNSAGITIGSPVVSTRDEDWDHVLRTNLYGVFYCSRAALEMMMEQQWGRVINLSSLLAFIGEPAGSSYTASKGAINAFTKSLAREAGAYGVTVNAICPSLADTEMKRFYLQEGGDYARALEATLRRACPLSRPLEALDVADLALFLASDASSFITGQLLQIDGGAL